MLDLVFFFSCVCVCEIFAKIEENVFMRHYLSTWWQYPTLKDTDIHATVQQTAFSEQNYKQMFIFDGFKSFQMIIQVNDYLNNCLISLVFK